MLRVGAREDSGPAAPTRLAANLWHVAFAILVVVDFTGLVYSGLLAGETRFVSLALGSFLVLSLTPFAVGGYGAQLGRASGRARVCQYVVICVVDVSIKKKERYIR